jgi:hypothetical protein
MLIKRSAWYKGNPGKAFGVCDKGYLPSATPHACNKSASRNCDHHLVTMEAIDEYMCSSDDLRYILLSFSRRAARLGGPPYRKMPTLQRRNFSRIGLELARLLSGLVGMGFSPCLACRVLKALFPSIW